MHDMENPHEAVEIGARIGVALLIAEDMLKIGKGWKAWKWESIKK